MSDRVRFEATVRPLVRGRAAFDILRRPPDLAPLLQAAGARHVEGRIAAQPVNLALSRAPQVDGLFLWAGQTLPDSQGEKPGVQPEIWLRPTPPDAVDTPGNVGAALCRSGPTGAWQRLTPGRRRGLIHRSNTAWTGPARVRRRAATHEGLTE
jgi:hypothetical protein